MKIFVIIITVFVSVTLLSFTVIKNFNKNLKTEHSLIVQNGKNNKGEKVIKTNEEWKKILTKEQYYVTREKGTEKAFSGKYYHNNEKGVYICVNCGNELFGSSQKYDSESGWPSFWSPISKENVTVSVDNSYGMTRDEITCSRCGAHLGHVFNDGPAPTHLRYCINSAALNFEKEK